ncbi:MAG: hypothetical protein C4581_07300 [Nitrospiraceae bacterium]|nr:MAG: hypothetical protein C4581_07300 [Nitrospiraceae bacterium]
MASLMIIGQSVWSIARLNIVIFSLYLLGDAFYRWDGFRYHSSLSEFLPAVALASMLCGIIALIISVVLSIILSSISWICKQIKLNISMHHLLTYIGFFIITGALTWKLKKIMLPQVQTTANVKIIVFFSILLVTAFITWLFRNRAERWIRIVQDRITPLVWMFSAFILASVPLVFYHSYVKDVDNAAPETSSRPIIIDKKRPNIILLTFDALSAKNMSVYSYNRQTTPFIAEWSKTATVFTNLEAASNWTVPTAASLMTGKRPWTHRAVHLQGSKPIKSDTENLPLLLKEGGYFNIAIVANPLASVKALGIAAAFDIAPPSIEFSNRVANKLLYRFFAFKIKLYDWIIQEDFILGQLLHIVSPDVYVTSVPPEEAFKQFLAILSNNPPEPYFAWLHILPPHAPFLPPTPYMGTYDASDKMRTYKSQWKIIGKVNEYNNSAGLPAEVKSVIEVLRSRYDEFINYCDKQFEDFFNLLKNGNKFANTVVIISADHGESFDHEYLTHGGIHLYEQVTNIPLIIKEPFQEVGKVIHTPVEQIDVSALILDMAGIPAPSWIEGHSLLPLMHGEEIAARPVFSMNLEKSPSRDYIIDRGTISVRDGNYKLIHYLDENKSLLFNVYEDPGELINLSDSEHAISQRLFSLISENLKIANKRYPINKQSD